MVGYELYRRQSRLQSGAGPHPTEGASAGAVGTTSDRPSLLIIETETVNIGESISSLCTVSAMISVASCVRCPLTFTFLIHVNLLFVQPILRIVCPQNARRRKRKALNSYRAYIRVTGSQPDTISFTPIRLVYRIPAGLIYLPINSSNLRAMIPF